MDDDEDSYTTERYAKFVKHGGNITFADLGSENIFVPLQAKKLKTPKGVQEGDDVADEITLFLLVCLQTEDEKSFLDEILFESEIKINQSHLDQREKQEDLKLNSTAEEDNEADITEAQPEVPEEDQAILKLQIRFCYSQVMFVESLLKDLRALLQKEQEYLSYLEGCMNNISMIIVKTQAIVRGFLVRRRNLKKKIKDGVQKNIL